MKQQVRECVFGSVLELPESEWPADDANLFDLGMDSMTILRILVAIEETLGVKLSERDLEPSRVETIDALVGWIEQQSSGG